MTNSISTYTIILNVREESLEAVTTHQMCGAQIFARPRRTFLSDDWKRSPNRPRGLIRAVRGRLFYWLILLLFSPVILSISEESLNMWHCARSGGREIFAPRVPHLISCFFPLLILREAKNLLEVPHIIFPLIQKNDFCALQTYPKNHFFEA